VRTPSAAYTARRAFGCVVSPEPGDLALISFDEDGAAYILQVLERARGDHASLDMPGDLRLTVSGQLRIQAQGLELDAGAETLRAAAAEEISLVSPGKTSVVTSELNVHAAEGQAFVGKLALAGDYLMSQWGKVKAAAKTVDKAVERVVARFGSSYRYVRELDETNAGTQRTLVDGTHAVHAKNSVHTAEGNVKIDGEQIHLG
jgi:hypothetical protein